MFNMATTDKVVFSWNWVLQFCCAYSLFYYTSRYCSYSYLYYYGSRSAAHVQTFTLQSVQCTRLGLIWGVRDGGYNWPYFPHIGLNPFYCGFFNFSYNDAHTVQYKRRAVVAQTARSRCKLLSVQFV